MSIDSPAEPTTFTKEVSTPKRCEHFIFPIADGTAKLFERDHGVRESTVRRGQPVRSEDLKEELQGDSEIDETQDHAEARNDFWSIQGDFIYRHHSEPRVQLPKEKTFQFK